MTLEFHPIANLFPMIEGKAYQDLLADIREHGLHEEIVMLDGKILDGRNRYRAAVDAGLFGENVNWKADWRFVDFSEAYQGQDPLAWVISHNLHRRHLSEGQRAWAASQIESYRQGGKPKADDAEDANLHQTDEVQRSPDGAERPGAEGARQNANSTPSAPGTTRKQAAELMNTSPRSVAHAAAVKKTGAPELQDAVRDGKIAVSAAADVAKLPADQQREIVKSGDAKKIKKAASEARRELTDSEKALATPRPVSTGKGLLADLDAAKPDTEARLDLELLAAIAAGQAVQIGMQGNLVRRGLAKLTLTPEGEKLLADLTAGVKRPQTDNSANDAHATDPEVRADGAGGDVLPAPQPLSSDQINAIIAAAYDAKDKAGNPAPVDFEALEKRTGLKKVAIKKRASRMNKGSEARRKAAQAAHYKRGAA